MKEVFNTLNAINVNGHTEDKGKLTYLSWTWAWAEVKKVYPDAQYTIWKDEQNRPYVYDPNLGYMVYTTVTIENMTHEMWLPVMDGQNKAMKSEPWSWKDRYGKEHWVDSATMFDINKTIMRCLTKNLAMFGLGLYIYAGEDLPEVEKESVVEPKKAPKVLAKDKIDNLAKELERTGIGLKGMLKAYGVTSITALSDEQYEDALEKLKAHPDKEQ